MIEEYEDLEKFYDAIASGEIKHPFIVMQSPKADHFAFIGLDLEGRCREFQISSEAYAKQLAEYEIAEPGKPLIQYCWAMFCSMCAGALPAKETTKWVAVTGPQS